MAVADEKQQADREKVERIRAVDLAMSQIEKQFGKGSIMRLGTKEVLPISVISTGAISFDAALGAGGFPRGRVVEIFGPESSGKTTISLQVVAEAHKSCGLAAFIDAEHAHRIRHDRDHDRGVRDEAAMRGEAERAAVALVPAREIGDARDHVAQAPGVDRVLVERLAVVRQLRQAELRE